MESERPITQRERIIVLQYLGTPKPKKFLALLDATGLAHIDELARRNRKSELERAIRESKKQ